MRPVLTTSDLRVWDQLTIKDQSISSFQLMERAANAFCTLYMSLFKHPEQVTCILAGPGNNGGDGFAISRLLVRAGLKAIYIYEDSESTSNLEVNDRNKNRRLLQNMQEVNWIQSTEELIQIYKTNTIYTIDAVFGTGLNRVINPNWEAIFSIVNKYSHKTISVDIPSGLNSDQEQLHKEAAAIISADHTFTFQTYKRAMTFPETGIFCDRIHVLDIGLSKRFIPETHRNMFLLDHSIWQYIGRSNTFDHKGSNGKTLHYCGSQKMPGAGVLCSRAAHRCGAGYVISLVPEVNVDMMISRHPELLLIPYNESDGFSMNQIISENEGISSILAGPGLSTSELVRKSIVQLLEMRLDIPLVLDADALNVLNGRSEALSTWPGPLVITPHVKEFDRLFGESHSWFERENKMRKLSESLQICIVLKGAFTRISFGDGTLFINTSGNPGLAKAGSGDVLSGILSGHLARYKDFKAAVLSAVYLHGKAADDLTAHVSEKSILATDLIEQLGKSIKLLESNE